MNNFLVSIGGKIKEVLSEIVVKWLLRGLTILLSSTITSGVTYYQTHMHETAIQTQITKDAEETQGNAEILIREMAKENQEAQEKKHGHNKIK